jgi:hypothetical protein
MRSCDTIARLLNTHRLIAHEIRAIRHASARQIGKTTGILVATLPERNPERSIYSSWYVR